MLDTGERGLPAPESRQDRLGVLTRMIDLERCVSAGPGEGLRQIRHAIFVFAHRRHHVIRARLVVGRQRGREQASRTEIDSRRARRAKGPAARASRGVRDRHTSDEASGAEGYTLTAFRRYSISASMSAGSETVSAISWTS